MSGLLTLEGLDRDRLTGLLDKAEGFVGSRPSDICSGATVTTAFFEASTRTRLSFELAAHRLGADVMTFTPDLSSTIKGESFKDTILTLTAIGTDLFVVRHRLADGAERTARWSGRPVINGGVGSREHPTQTLIDAMLEVVSDRILFSTDWPFENVDHAARWFDAAPISEDDRRKIGRDNALRLFRLNA